VASTFYRPNSKYIWIRYKDANGKWTSSSTGYRRDNLGDVRQAGLVARQKTLEEQAEKPTQARGANFDDWVNAWIDQRWGHLDTCTPRYYRRYFMQFCRYLNELGIQSPGPVTREIVLAYLPWRQKHGAGRNTALMEIKFMGQVLGEAMKRGFIKTNPASKLGIQFADQEHKTPWSDEEIKLVGEKLEREARFGWLHVSYLMGLYQAVRLRQSVVPIRSIDLTRGVINYPSNIVKGRKGFSQPIDPVFTPTLRSIIEHRRNTGEQAICTMPELPSLQWRQFLDTLSLHHLSHHGLRASLITRYALAGVPEAMTRRFVNHASQLVHEVYQNITASDLAPMFGMIHRKSLLDGITPENQHPESKI